MSKSKSMKAPDRPSSKMRQAPVPKVVMNVKLYFQQNWRRDVRVFQTENRTEYRKFVKSVKSVLKLRDNIHIVLKWQDNTGDMITVSSDLEMQLATKHIRSNDTLNICVQLLEEVAIPTLCDKCDQTIICNIRYKCDRCLNFVCCVRCYQCAHPKTSIHEHELYKEKFPCYCPMHRVSETDVPTFSNGAAAVPYRMLRHGDRGRSSSMPNGLGRLIPNGVEHMSGYSRSGSMDGGRSMQGQADEILNGFYPTSPYSDNLPAEHNYRTAERSEVVRGPNGDVYQQQQTSVIESPHSGVVAIRSRRSRETRSKSHQLG